MIRVVGLILLALLFFGIPLAAALSLAGRPEAIDRTLIVRPPSGHTFGGRR